MKTQNLLQDEYSTKDLYLAAFLQVKGMTVKKLEQYGWGKRGQNPVYFIFGNRKRCEELEDIFWNGTGDEIVANIKDYSTTIRDLRVRISSIARLIRKEELFSRE